MKTEYVRNVVIKKPDFFKSTNNVLVHIFDNYMMFNTERIVKDMKGGKEDMTEKRFSVKKSGSGLYYRDGDYEIDNTIQFIIETVEMKLNQLYDENEQLKQRNEFLKKRCDEYWEESGLNSDY